MDLPLVDLAAIAASASARARAAAALDDALRTAGFAAVVRHGIHPRLVARTNDALRTFFDQTPDVKRSVTGDEVGYRDAGTVESFVAHPGHDRGRSANRWPVDVLGFRETLVAYLGAASALADRVSLLASMAAGHDEAWSASGLAHAGHTLCADRHPGAGDPVAPSAVDDRSLSLLGADGVDGLELRTRSGEWVAVCVPRGSLVVLAGDALAVESGGRWLPTPHRIRAVGTPRIVVALHQTLAGTSAGLPRPTSTTRVA